MTELQERLLEDLLRVMRSKDMQPSEPALRWLIECDILTVSKMRRYLIPCTFPSFLIETSGHTRNAIYRSADHHKCSEGLVIKMLYSKKTKFRGIYKIK